MRNFQQARTNYFCVTDKEKFEQIIEKCEATDTIVIFDEKQEDGSIKYGFYCEGEIHGLQAPSNEPCDDVENEDCADYDYNFDDFCKALMQVVAHDDAIIITEISVDGVRSLRGYGTVITQDSFKCITIGDETLNLARIMLENPDFTTKNEY